MLCPGRWCNPDLLIFTDLMMFITGRMIYIICIDFVLFKNLEQFQLFYGHGPERGHMLALSCSVSQLGVTETHNHEMVQSYVTLPFLLS
jgi:hypothetical protein